jgi:hypothetical protein
MNPKWAEENLQTIRTLMERSAIYRRALAPIMIYVGVVGIIGGAAGRLFQIDAERGFILLWVGDAALALAGSFLLVRRQAMKDSEPFWSPPTRRVAQAFTPAFFIGFVLAVLCMRGSTGSINPERDDILVGVWVLLYGCAIHAAGFFMPRGMRWLAWVFIIVGILNCVYVTLYDEPASPHLVMAAIFGGLHLAYGIYLYFTEPKNPVA